MTKHRWQRPLLSALGIPLILLGCVPNGPLATAPPPLTVRSTAQLVENASLPILRFSRVDDPRHPGRQIYRGGLPSDVALQRLATLGIKTIVSLEDANDQDGKAADIAHEREVATRLGMAFINLPIPDGEAPSAWTVERLFQIVSESERAPVFIHCLWGRDRTGAMIAAYRIRVNKHTAEQALTEMASFGYEPAWYPSLEQFVRDYAAPGV